MRHMKDALTVFFLDRKHGLKKAAAFLASRKDSMLTEEELWEKYETFALSKLNKHLSGTAGDTGEVKVFCLFLKEARILGLEQTMAEHHSQLFDIRERWMNTAFNQKLSDKGREQPDSSKNLYHRIQRMIKENREENVYWGRWYGRGGLGDEAIRFEPHLSRSPEESFIYRLPQIHDLAQSDFYAKNGRRLRFEGFGRALDYVQEEVEKKTASLSHVFYLYFFMGWLNRWYTFTTNTVSMERRDGSSRCDSIGVHDKEVDDTMEKISLYLDEKLSDAGRIIFKMKREEKGFEEIRDALALRGLRLKSDSSLTYYYNTKVKDVVAEACAKYGLTFHKKQFRAFLDQYRLYLFDRQDRA